MKKIVFIFSLICLFGLFLLPKDVSANDFDLKGCRLYIGGEEVTSNKRSGDGWTFDASTNTIILNNFAIGTKGSFMGRENKGFGIYRKFAIIYVETPVGCSLDLNIHSTGNTTNVIGDESYSGEFYTFLNSFASAFYGIFNNGGNVTITGTTDLIIGAHLDAINASSLTVDTNSWVYAKSYTCAVDVTHLTVKGTGRISTLGYCASSSVYGYNSTIKASRSINIYDNAQITAEMYRDENCDNYAVSGIYTYTLNARGGRIESRCYANGLKATKGNGIDCIAILASQINISGGTKIEAYVFNNTRKTYIGSAAVGHIYQTNSIINFEGAGTLCTGIQMKRPSNDTEAKKEILYSVRDIKSEKHINITTSTTRPKNFENFDTYEEKVATEGDGVYFRNNNGNTEWSYFRDFRKIEKSQDKAYVGGGILSKLIEIGDILKDNANFQAYILSGNFILIPKNADDNLQKITVEAGSLKINFTGGNKYIFKNPIEIKKGGTVTVDGDGIAEGLNVTGNGKIKFNGGTVTGKVYKPVDMIVDGGNINVTYYDTNNNSTVAYNSSGQKVSGIKHTLSSYDKKFEKINVVRLKNREYGSNGMYPLEENKMYIWVVEADEVTSARVTYYDSKNSEYKTISLYKSYAIYDLVEGGNITANYSSLHSVTKGTKILLHPMNLKNANISSLTLKWAYSDDGTTWIDIDNSFVDEYGNLSVDNVPIEYNGRQYRCEIYSKYDDELLDVFQTELYVYSSTLESDDGFIDGKKATIRITPEIPIPKTLYFRSNWYVSKDGGNSFTFIPSTVADTTNKTLYEFIVEDDMDGWIIKCESASHIGRYEFPTYNVSYITINVTEKKVRIEEQPEGKTFENFDNNDIEHFEIKARNATNYQWQVSKRNYLNNDVPFEDIPGATSSKYAFFKNSITRDKINYVYRCIVSNEYGEVISNEIYNTVSYRPLFSSIEKNMSVGIDGIASVTIHIDGGNPVIPTTLVWKVIRASDGTLEDLTDEVMNGVEYTIREVIMTDGKTKYNHPVLSTLIIENPTSDMNDWIFFAYLYYEDQVIDKARFNLIILTECQAHGHDFLPATCTQVSKCSREGCEATTGDLLSHSGGTPTCIEQAICEVCGAHYGELDPTNHSGTDKWNEDQLDNASGHESTWSCCGKPKHAFEKHSFHEGICTVCDYICDHSVITASNCHERKHCHICQMDFATVDPNNHDLSKGTFTRGMKEATCTDDGYTGDLICWNCMDPVTRGDVIKALGHSESLPATCKSPAYCSVCKSYYGEIDPHNHAEWSYFEKDETHHELHWTCCEMVTVENHDFDDDGVCTICHYGCKHSGGIATCFDLAICDKCNEPYGQIDPHNHVGAIFYNHDDETHTGTCACGKELEKEEHHFEHGICKECFYECTHIGGIATCLTKAICEKCKESYGEQDHNNHTGKLIWVRNDTTHFKKWSCCNDETKEEEHNIVDGVCTICHYGCKHTGGIATCLTKAICDVCEEEYGEVNPHNHSHLEHVSYIPSTQEQEGNIEYWYCKDCNKYYSDKTLSIEITKEDTIIKKLEEKANTGKIVLAITIPTVSGLGVAGGALIYFKKKRRS